MKCHANHSRETIGHYFHKVLDACLQIRDDFVRPPTLETPWHIAENPRWYPYFKVTNLASKPMNYTIGYGWNTYTTYVF